MKRIVMALLATALFVVPACSTEESLCDDKCDCEGCSDRQYDDCVHDYESDERAADNRNCLDLYDDLVDCRADTGYCDGGYDWETDCGREKDRLKDCID